MQRVVKDTPNQSKWIWIKKGEEMDPVFATKRANIIKAVNIARRMDYDTLVNSVVLLPHLSKKIRKGYSLLQDDGVDTIISDPNTYAQLIRSNNIDDMIVEYNEKKDELGRLYSIRILIRDKKSYPVKYKASTRNNKFSDEWIEGDSNLCTSIELINFFSGSKTPELKIVTSYYNLDNDNHDTLNPGRYINK